MNLLQRTAVVFAMLGGGLAVAQPQPPPEQPAPVVTVKVTLHV